MAVQSCNHILLVEPQDFFSNPQTVATNPYQDTREADHDAIKKRAVMEHQDYRNQIIEAGIAVTIAKGQSGTPDDIFGGNCYSTHQDGTAYVYSMMAPNRREEKRPYLTNLVTRGYNNIVDYTPYEDQDLFLEGTGSMVMDHVNRVVYSSLSPRTNPEMVKKWAAEMDYEPVLFHSTNHVGASVYHTDLILYIGSEMAGFVSGCVDDEYKKPVLDKLSKTHDVVEFDREQLIQMVGNSLEVRNNNDEKCLIMSDTAYKALNNKQHDKISSYYKTIIHPDIKTIEQYGGGSARCLILELF